ncbi:MAG: hypothetical protein EOO87_00515 [Pedobacter sp.]|nr:MAG: hypothetical protein EOO87_00515 [Pedobacter sp.]
MRILLRSFAFLDLISLVFLGMQLVNIAQFYGNLQLQSEKLQSVMMFPMFFLVLFGAVLLFRGKKLGFVLYYIQFPFRLYLWVFSLGFITLLPEAFGLFQDFWFGALLKLCFVGEFIRLFLTVRAHLKINDELPNKSY